MHTEQDNEENPEESSVSIVDAARQAERERERDHNGSHRHVLLTSMAIMLSTAATGKVTVGRTRSCISPTKPVVMVLLPPTSQPAALPKIMIPPLTSTIYIN